MGDGEVEYKEYCYSYAKEYDGPPIRHELPRALPIIVDRIPVAVAVAVAVLSQLSPPSPSDNNNKTLPPPPSLPVAQPVIIMPSTTTTTTNLLSKSKHSLSPPLPRTAVVSLISPPTTTTTSLDPFPNSCQFSDINDSSNSSSSTTTTASLTPQQLLASSSSSSSATLDFSDSFHNSTPLDDYDNDDGFDQPDWPSSDSLLSFDYPSSAASSNQPQPQLRPPFVTFRDIHSDTDDDDHVTTQNQTHPPRILQVKPHKGGCYRCFKGNRFTEKEVCLVCDSKFCANCVLRAMGSMPQGRKCLPCIGFPILESKRSYLGKCSRMLKRLLTPLEVQHIINAEKSCPLNQLPPHSISVNGNPLSHQELLILLNCTNPPKKLKPGNYWYDKVSGLWGKDRDKPSQIITPHLSVGPPIKVDASSGNTNVFINGREITKVELRMLQLAGVQCAGNPHFWVNADGSYQEEGQKNTKGYIWGKAGTKLVCAVLSLPVPSKSSYPCGEQLNNGISRTVLNYLEQRPSQKILLIGFNGSGTSTIFKQAKILYKDIPFEDDERENIKLLIQGNVYRYLGILLEGRERFEDEYSNEEGENQFNDDNGPTGNDEKNVYSICPRLKAFSDWLLKIMVSGNLEIIFPAATREYAPLVEELWSDAAIQATYSRRSELEMLPSVASYFLERAVDVLRTEYVPSDVDILYAEGVTSSNGLAFLDFSFPQLSTEDNVEVAKHNDSPLRFQLVRVQSRGIGENCKWLEMFEDVKLVIFCVSLIDYDQFGDDGDGNWVNKMLMSRNFFESIVTHPTYDQMDFLLIINKYDLFEEKIERVPLTRCEWFDDFCPVVSRNRSNNSNSISNGPCLSQLAFHYIAVKFKRLFSSLTDRKLYVSLAKGLEPDSVDGALQYAREILKWDEERSNFSLSGDYSIYSTDASSFSP